MGGDERKDKVCGANMWRDKQEGEVKRQGLKQIIKFAVIDNYIVFRGMLEIYKNITLFFSKIRVFRMKVWGFHQISQAELFLMF